MAAARWGSLHALEQTRRHSFWQRRQWGGPPSADTVGRVFAGLELAGLRRLIGTIYTRLKRNKVLGTVLVLDGHESTASYLRSCPGCLRRRMRDGRIQYYHRDVTAMLVGGKVPFLLDCEPQRPKEGEVACAERLLRRILAAYPRAFDLVVVDGLYLKAPFVRLLLKHHKDVLIVLKDERRDLLRDALGLFRLEPPSVENDGSVTRQVWDIEGLESWPALGRPVRVIRSLETRSVRRQRTRQPETSTSDWIWATTLSRKTVSAATIIRWGHERWLIENQGFREAGTVWHADHVYHHHPQAITAFLLTTLLVMNLVRAFIRLNLSPGLRAGRTSLYFCRLISADFFAETGLPP